MGNVGVRRVQPSSSGVQLDISSPVVVGVPTYVRWTLPAGALSRSVLFQVKGPLSDVEVGGTEIEQGQIALVIPCTFGGSAQIGIVMLDSATDRVLASKTIETLPAGPDCL